MLLTLYVGFLVVMSSIFVSNVYAQSNDCGHVSRKNSEEGEWPWMVAITRNLGDGHSAFRCNGFLINRRHVLTTAHCFAGIYFSKFVDFTARIGKKNWNEGEEYEISCIIKHPRFDPEHFYDDIAIITLSRDVDTPNYVPICLPGDHFRTMRLDALTFTKALWHKDDRRFGNRNLMQFTGLHILSNKNCNKFLSNHSSHFFPGAVSGDMLCTVKPSDQLEPYIRSEGAPLMYKDNENKWIAVGLTILVLSYGTEGQRDVYIKVSDYMEWIVENTKNGKDPCF